MDTWGRCARAIAVMAAVALALSGCSTIAALTRTSEPTPPPECVTETTGNDHGAPTQSLYDAVAQSGFASPDASISIGYQSFAVEAEFCLEPGAGDELLPCTAPTDGGQRTALGRDLQQLSEAMLMVSTFETMSVTASGRDEPPVYAQVTVWHAATSEALADARSFLGFLLDACSFEGTAMLAQSGSVAVVDVVPSTTGVTPAPEALDALLRAFLSIETPVRASAGWTPSADAGACVSDSGLVRDGTIIDPFIAAGVAVEGPASASERFFVKGTADCRIESPDVEVAACEVRPPSEGKVTLWRDREQLTEWLFASGMDAVLFVDASLTTADGTPVSLEASAWRYPSAATMALPRLQSILGACADPPVAAISVDQAYFVVMEEVSPRGAEPRRVLTAAQLADAAETWAHAVIPFDDLATD